MVRLSTHIFQKTGFAGLTYIPPTSTLSYLGKELLHVDTATPEWYDPNCTAPRIVWQTLQPLAGSQLNKHITCSAVTFCWQLTAAPQRIVAVVGLQRVNAHPHEARDHKYAIEPLHKAAGVGPHRHRTTRTAAAGRTHHCHSPCNILTHTTQLPQAAHWVVGQPTLLNPSCLVTSATLQSSATGKCTHPDVLYPSAGQTRGAQAQKTACSAVTTDSTTLTAVARPPILRPDARPYQTPKTTPKIHTYARPYPTPKTTANIHTYIDKPYPCLTDTPLLLLLLPDAACPAVHRNACTQLLRAQQKCADRGLLADAPEA
jgi:hypothetical protein